MNDAAERPVEPSGQEDVPAADMESHAVMVHSPVDSPVADSRLPEVDVSDSTLFTGPLRSTVFLLALPVLAEQLLNFFVGFTDTFLSGRISAAATSAIGVGAYVNWLIELMFSLVGTGAAALIARHWGAGRREEACRVASCSISLAVAAGVLGVAALWLLAPLFGQFLEMAPDSNALLVQYLRMSSFGHVFSSICLVGGSILRAAGHMRAPMWILGLVSVLNLIFSSLMVYGVGPIPPLGISGIAGGTVLARLAGGAIMLLVLTRGVTGLHAPVRRSALTDVSSVRRILRIGLPAAADGMLMWSGHFLFVRIIAGLGEGAEATATLAAHIVGVQVEAMNYLPAWAWGTAAATMIGQCLGAGLPERARRGGSEAVLQACLPGLLVMVTFYFGAPAIYGLMHDDPRVAEIGVPAMRLLALFEIPLSIAVVCIVGIRGSGDTIVPMLINASGIFLLRLPLAWWFAVKCDGGLMGAWTGMCIDVTVRAIVIGLYFRFGPWIRKKV